MRDYSRVQAEIDLDALRHNIDEIKQNVKPETKIMTVVKADGYGHGAIAVSHALMDKVDAFGVAILPEALNLRKAGVGKIILVLGYTPKEYYKELIQEDISQTIFEYEMAKNLSEEAKKQNKKAKIHIKVDTGMGRIGFADTAESVAVIEAISQLEGIELEGIFTHFACADEADKKSVKKQIERFERFCKELSNRKLSFSMIHASNSAGVLDLPEANYNMVRCGIITYGLYPSEEVNKRRLCLRPAMQLVSHVVFVKEVEAGCGISYNSIYVTKRKTKVATIPVGYADGYPRGLSSKGRVLIHGKSAPIIGRICMDQMMVDVTDIPDVKTSDRVTLIGKDKDACIPVEEAANLAGSFSYEFICNLSKRVPRIYIEHGNVVGFMDYSRNEVDAVKFNS